MDIGRCERFYLHLADSAVADLTGDLLGDDRASRNNRLSIGAANVAARRVTEEAAVVGRECGVDLAIRRLDEPVRVGPGVRRQRADETDVRSFRSLDGADTSVVRVVNVTDVEARALTRETAGTEGR